MSFLAYNEEQADGSFTTKYLPVTADRELKLTKLIQSKKLPPSFKLEAKTILSDNIIGFCDNLVPPPVQPSITSMDELRAKVHQSEWYQRSKSLQRA